MQQSALFEKKNIYSSLSTELTVFKGKLEGLATGDIFDQRSVGNSDDTVALATVDSGALQGTYDINVTQLSTASSQVGSLDVGSELHNQ